MSIAVLAERVKSSEGTVRRLLMVINRQLIGTEGLKNNPPLLLIMERGESNGYSCRAGAGKHYSKTSRA